MTTPTKAGCDKGQPEAEGSGHQAAEADDRAVKAAAGASGTGSERSVSNVLRGAISGAVGAVTAAEEEMARLASRLVEISEHSPDEIRRVVGELLGRVRKQREEVERRAEDGLRSAISRMLSPLVGEISSLRERVEQLNTRLDEYRRARSRGPEASAGSGFETVSDSPTPPDPSAP